SLDISLTAEVDGAPASTGVEVSSGLTIDHVFVSVSQVQLVSDVEVEGHDVPGAEVADLLGSSPSFLLQNAPPALYSRVRFHIVDPKSGDPLPVEFKGRPLSLLILGQASIEGGQTTVPFRYLDERPYNVDLSSSQGLDLLPDMAGSFQVIQ